MKKAAAVILAIIMLAQTLCVLASGEDRMENKFTIINPYECVDWSSWDTYKACLHLHTTASDGDVPLYEMIKAYYDAGYDILAVTDHGVVNNGWMKPKKTNGIFNGFRRVTPLTKEQYDYFANGEDRNGRGITDVTGGIECNMAVISKTHVNGYFTTYGQGVWGKENDYRTAPAEIEKAGGYSVLNHVGDWTDAEDYPERSSQDWYVGYFADIFTSYASCLGMEICNNTDRCTRSDKILWDNLLSCVIPAGRNIWAFADDDSEYLDEVGRSFEMFVLPENTEENVKKAMADGNFFACCRYLKTPDHRDEFDGDGLVPIVSNIVADSGTGRITVETDPSRNCESIKWISDGKVVSEDFRIDLNEVADKLGCYVRFVLRGTGGMTYSQAFELRYAGRPEKAVPEMKKNTPYGNMLPCRYHSIWFALGELIREKINDKIEDLRK